MGFFSSIGGILGGIGGLAFGPIGAVVGSGLGGTLGGAVDANKANKTAQGYYNQQMDFARQQAQFQQDYAKHVMEWRVEDAKNAGVHPMAALGISNPSYSPVSAPSAPSFADAGSFDTGSTFGQSLNRASFQAKTMAQQEQAARLGFRTVELQNRGLELDNLQKSLQIGQMASELQRNAASSAPSPTANKAPGLIGGQNDSVSSGDSIAPGVSPLLGASRLGNSIFLHINPDVSDAVTEDFVRNMFAIIAIEGQIPRMYSEIAKRFTKEEQEALKRGDAQLEYIGPSQIQFLWRPHMKPWISEDGHSGGGKIPSYYFKK